LFPVASPVVGSSPTDATGVYTISGLPVDSYEAVASDCSNSPAVYSPVDYAHIHGLDRNIAHFITFKSDGQTKKGVNFKMPKAGYIDVSVVDCPPPHVPISNINVVPYSAKLDRKHDQFQSGFGGFSDINGMVTLPVTVGDNKLAVFVPDPTNPPNYKFDSY